MQDVQAKYNALLARMEKLETSQGKLESSQGKLETAQSKADSNAQMLVAQVEKVPPL